MLLLCVSSFDAAGWRWPHFTPHELACKCQGRFCDGEYWHDPDFLDALEALRAACGRALVINSGHRCTGWNARIGGARRSRHLQLAADISLSGHDRHALRAEAEALGFTGIGLGTTFIHLDRREQPASWFYAGSETAWKS